MENIATSDLLTVIVSGGLITALVSILKPHVQKFNPQALVLGIAVLVGVAYQTFSTLVPVDSQQAILNFVYGSVSSAVFIYEFIWKNLFKKKLK